MKHITIYTTKQCLYCRAAKHMLRASDIDFDEVDLTEDEKLRKKISKQTNWRTVPMIFVGDEFIGGHSQLLNLHSTGVLKEMMHEN